MTQQKIIPAKEMTITTMGGLVPRMEITVTRPACKAPRESDTSHPKNQNHKGDRKVEHGVTQSKE
ncbi:MAG: hypothetical protein FWC50_08865 [Planctomycetaceae bacterium]|nr:hypothetical protein [Planctomycetaceae bacterium]